MDIVGGRDGWKEVKRFWADSGHLQLYSLVFDKFSGDIWFQSGRG